MGLTAVTRALGRPAGWVLAGLLFVLLVGIVGMHGLGPHGASSIGHHEAGLQAGGDGGAEVGGIDPTMAVVVAVDHQSTEVSGAADEHGSAIVELCLAVLLGLATFFLLLGATGRRRTSVLPAHPHQTWAGRGRAPVPRSLAQLSLLRC